MGRPYTQYGSIPVPCGPDFWAYKEGLRAWRLAYCPVNQGGPTYYYSWSRGSDSGAGTFASPYKSITKLNNKITAGSTHYLIGPDVWADGTGIYASTNNVSVAAFGGPVTLNNFTLPYQGGWTQAGSSNRWTRAESHTVGWVRMYLDLAAPLQKMTDGGVNAVTSTPLSWYWDGSTLHLNPGVGVNPNAIAYEGVPDNQNAGIDLELNCDACLVQNIRSDGFGCSATGTPYNVRCAGNPFTEAVLDGVQAYCGGIHAIGALGANNGHDEIVTMVNCRAGYTCPLSGESVYVGYSGGAHERNFWNCVAARGTLPADSWYPAAPKRAQGFFGHGNPANPCKLIIFDKCSTPNNPFGAIGACEFNPNDAPAASRLEDVRVFVIDERVQGFGQGMISKSHHLNTAYINGIYEFTNDFTSALMVGDQCGGWSWNNTFALDCAVPGGGTIFNYPPPHSPQFWYDLFLFLNTSGSSGGQLFSQRDASTDAPTASLINSIIASLGSGSYSAVNLLNDGLHVLANAYWNITTVNDVSSTRRGYSNDPAKVVLSSAPSEGYTPVPGDPFHRAGRPLPGGYMLAYDQLWRPRGPGNAPTIGPLSDLVTAGTARPKAVAVVRGSDLANPRDTDAAVNRGSAKISPRDKASAPNRGTAK